MSDHNPAPDFTRSPQIPNAKAAMAAAVSLLTRRPLTRQELAGKLKQRGFDAKAVDRAIAGCERLGYLNDDHEASRYLEQLIGKRYGPRYIRAAMKKRGFDESAIDQLVTRYAESDREREAADAALQSRSLRFARETDARKRKEKRYRLLMNRGFTPMIVADLLREIGK